MLFLKTPQRLFYYFFILIFSLSAGKSALALSLDGLALEEPTTPFILTTELQDTPTSLQFNFHIAPGFHLYQSQFAIESTESSLIGSLQFPEGESVQDPLLGLQVIYHGAVKLTLLLPPEPSTFDLTLHYQGCKGETFCLPPEHQRFEVNLQSHEVRAVPDLEGSKYTDLKTEPTPDQALPLLWTLLSFFGLGLLLSFSPCVLPMLPIITGMLMASHQHTLKKQIGLCTAFVLGNTCILTLLGFGAVFLGASLQASLQSAWLIIPLISILFLMALSLLDYIHFHIPTGWLPRSKKQSYTSLFHAFLLGTFSGLIFSPCVSAPLVGALMLISMTHDYVLGGSSLFILGLGMGLPLMAMSIFGTHILPKRGPWMHQVKVLFAVLLFGLCVYLLSRLIPSSVTTFLWGSLTLCYGIYLVCTVRDAFKLALAALGFACLAYSGVAFFGLIKPSPVAQETLPWVSVTSTSALESELQHAAAQGKIAMVDVYASWCIACQHIEYFVLKDQIVQSELAPIARFRLDISQTDPHTQAWLKAHHIFGPPTQLFFDTQGKWLPTHTLFGEISAPQLVGTLKAIHPR